MLKTSVQRRGSFTPIPPAERKKAYRRKCACCLSEYGQMKSYDDDKGRRFFDVRQILDHALPRRFLSEHGIYEHDYRGLVSICVRCHGKKKVLEDRLYQGDVFGFMQGLKQMGYPIERLLRFVKIIGIADCFEAWRVK